MVLLWFKTEVVDSVQRSMEDFYLSTRRLKFDFVELVWFAFEVSIARASSNIDVYLHLLKLFKLVRNGLLDVQLVHKSVKHVKSTWFIRLLTLSKQVNFEVWVSDTQQFLSKNLLIESALYLKWVWVVHVQVLVDNHRNSTCCCVLVRVEVKFLWTVEIDLLDFLHELGCYFID